MIPLAYFVGFPFMYNNLFLISSREGRGRCGAGGWERVEVVDDEGARFVAATEA